MKMHRRKNGLCCHAHRNLCDSFCEGYIISFAKFDDRAASFRLELFLFISSYCISLYVDALRGRLSIVTKEAIFVYLANQPAQP